MTVIDLGALCFGIVVGWITSRTLRRTTTTGLSDIATVIGSVAGAAVTGIWQPSTNAFGYYCIGLFIGFFLYLIIAVATAKKTGHLGDWLGSEAGASATATVTTTASSATTTSA